MVPGRWYSTGPPDPNEPTGGWGYNPWGSTATSTSISYPVTATSTNYVRLVPELPDFAEVPHRVLTREAHDWLVRRSREKSPAPLTAKARHGFQQLARIPCYRGVRTR